jgi:transcriptional regulator with XRE-family HTH domain
MDIGKKIIELRTAKGWTQYRLHKESGINQPTLSRFEKGINIPSAEMIQKICDSLGVSMAEFDDNYIIDDLRSQVLEKMGDIEWSLEEKEAVDIIKKMPLNEQQQSFLKTYEKFKRLSESDQEALSKIIDSLSSFQK